MTRSEFLEQAEMLRINQQVYDLDGGRRPESYILQKEGRAFKLFYSERGLETGAELFAHESAALERLLGLLAQDPAAQIP